MNKSASKGEEMDWNNKGDNVRIAFRSQKFRLQAEFQGTVLAMEHPRLQNHVLSVVVPTVQPTV